MAGLIALGEKFGADALRTAATPPLCANVHSYAYVREWLAERPEGLHREPAISRAGPHENLRGSAYYH